MLPRAHKRLAVASCASDTAHMGPAIGYRREQPILGRCAHGPQAAGTRPATHGSSPAGTGTGTRELT